MKLADKNNHNNLIQMKPVKILFIALAATLVSVASYAQTADEIIEKYFETIGGKGNWAALQGLKIATVTKVQGMEFPGVTILLKDGRQTNSAKFQGMDFYQQVFDGTTLWGTNQMTMKAEKSDAETTENFKANLGLDFPSPFLDYGKKGFKVELLGKETIDGTETFKIKLTKKPIKIDGQESENINFYYFDSENFVPILVEAEVKSGPGKGMISQIKMSDYQEVNGLMFAFSSSMGAKDQPGGFMSTISSIEFNPQVDPSLFAFPEGK